MWPAWNDDGTFIRVLCHQEGEAGDIDSFFISSRMMALSVDDFEKKFEKPDGLKEAMKEAVGSRGAELKEKLKTLDGFIETTKEFMNKDRYPKGNDSVLNQWIDANRDGDKDFFLFDSTWLKKVEARRAFMEELTSVKEGVSMKSLVEQLFKINLAFQELRIVERVELKFLQSFDDYMKKREEHFKRVTLEVTEMQEQLKRLDVGEDKRESVGKRLGALFSQLDSDFSAELLDLKTYLEYSSKVPFNMMSVYDPTFTCLSHAAEDGRNRRKTCGVYAKMSRSQLEDEKKKMEKELLQKTEETLETIKTRINEMKERINAIQQEYQTLPQDIREDKDLLKIYEAFERNKNNVELLLTQKQEAYDRR